MARARGALRSVFMLTTESKTLCGCSRQGWAFGGPGDSTPLQTSKASSDLSFRAVLFDPALSCLNLPAACHPVQ